MTTTTPWVGRNRPAIDAGEIVTGATTYVTDLRPEAVLHGAVLRSNLPHATIERIDVSAARALAGVHCVLTAAEVPVNALGPREVDGPVLAADRVRQVGEAIALVAADDEATAHAALAAIELDLIPLPVVDGPEAAAAPDAALLHWTGYISGRIAFSSGDVEHAISGAALVLRRDVTTPSQEHVAIDTPGGVAVVESETITIWCGSQNPGLHQRKVARALDVDVADVRMIANPVGGAFGSRNDDPMPVYLALLARATGRPVRVHMTREETMAAGAKR
ncbi:xanthine dehydrogenase family protein molybdopterin-binding subunit, partial [Pseudactinotalea sp.]|uniref:xanthine dehydrogenase family protein molybdopterin-binding subunit n=1 Tax=Pseudactinotalea sp. TaxID=1926260 RepID=UPI003B3B4D36